MDLSLGGRFVEGFGVELVFWVAPRSDADD